MILALDPSSTRTGYALMTAAGTLSEAGLLKPGKATDPAIVRIGAMGNDLALLIVAEGPFDAIVIEVPTGHTGSRHRGQGAGLATYGLAVGYLWRVCVQSGGLVYMVDENKWTGSVPKRHRTARISEMFRSYKPASDPGGDMADAIGLGRWYFLEQNMKQKIEMAV